MENISSNIKQRVLHVAESEGITKETFFEKIGMTYGNFKGKSKNTPLNSTAIENIFSIVPDLDLEWLITGKGQMYKSGRTAVLEDKNKLYYAPPGRLPKRTNPGAPIKFYDAQFAAGANVEFFDDTAMITPAYTMDIPEFAGCTAFRNYGESMEPLIKSSDILFSTKVENWGDGLEYGQIYGIIRHDGRRHLKYIRKAKEKEETHFLLRSENSEMFDDFLLAKEEIKSIWLIHGWINKRT